MYVLPAKSYTSTTWAMCGWSSDRSMPISLRSSAIVWGSSRAPCTIDFKAYWRWGEGAGGGRGGVGGGASSWGSDSDGDDDDDFDVDDVDGGGGEGAA
jgi:hypothetical protein